MELRNTAFHLLRQLFQQHTARWQHELPELTKPQYAVMRVIAEHPGIEQVDLTEAAVSTKATLAEMLSRMENRGLVKRETIRWINVGVLSISPFRAKRCSPPRYHWGIALTMNFWGD